MFSAPTATGLWWHDGNINPGSCWKYVLYLIRGLEEWIMDGTVTFCWFQAPLATTLVELLATRFISRVTSHVLPVRCYLSRVTSHALHLTRYISRVTSHALPLMRYISRSTSHVLHLTLYISRIISHVLPLTRYLSRVISHVTSSGVQQCEDVSSCRRCWSTVLCGCIWLLIDWLVELLLSFIVQRSCCSGV